MNKLYKQPFSSFTSFLGKPTQRIKCSQVPALTWSHCCIEGTYYSISTDSKQGVLLLIQSLCSMAHFIFKRES